MTLDILSDNRAVMAEKMHFVSIEGVGMFREKHSFPKGFCLTTGLTHKNAILISHIEKLEQRIQLIPSLPKKGEKQYNRQLKHTSTLIIEANCVVANSGNVNKHGK